MCFTWTFYENMWKRWNQTADRFYWKYSAPFILLQQYFNNQVKLSSICITVILWEYVEEEEVRNVPSNYNNSNNSGRYCLLAFLQIRWKLSITEALNTNKL